MLVCKTQFDTKFIPDSSPRIVVRWKLVCKTNYVVVPPPIQPGGYRGKTIGRIPHKSYLVGAYAKHAGKQSAGTVLGIDPFLITERSVVRNVGQLIIDGVYRGRRRR